MLNFGAPEYIGELGWLSLFLLKQGIKNGTQLMISLAWTDQYKLSERQTLLPMNALICATLL